MIPRKRMFSESIFTILSCPAYTKDLDDQLLVFQRQVARSLSGFICSFSKDHCDGKTAISIATHIGFSLFHFLLLLPSVSKLSYMRWILNQVSVVLWLSGLPLQLDCKGSH